MSEVNNLPSLPQRTVVCDDGVTRTGCIIDMPIKGTEHRLCTLKDNEGNLHNVKFSDLRKVLEYNSRRSQNNS